MDKVYKHTIETIGNKRKVNRRTKVNITNLEEEIRKSFSEYELDGGYASFYRAVSELSHKDILIPIRNKKTNGKFPSLSLLFWLRGIAVENKWNKLDMMQLNDRINLSFYEQNPQFQTEDEWEKIKSVYAFLKNVHLRKTVSIEERSFELFGDEKYLSKEKGFLRRIGISTEMLKATKHGEPFVSFLKPGVELKNIRSVLIIENQSYYHTCVHLLLQNKLPYNPDILIYGEGKKIENSFSFFSSIYPDRRYEFFYVGDIDPEGFSIYFRLYHRFERYHINLAKQIYAQMFSHFHKRNNFTEQWMNEEHRDFFISQLDEPKHAEFVYIMWNEKTRIPQETLTIENGEG